MTGRVPCERGCWVIAGREVVDTRPCTGARVPDFDTFVFIRAGNDCCKCNRYMHQASMMATSDYEIRRGGIWAYLVHLVYAHREQFGSRPGSRDQAVALSCRIVSQHRPLPKSKTG